MISNDATLFAEAMANLKTGPKKVLPAQPNDTALGRYNGLEAMTIANECSKYINMYQKPGNPIPRVIGGAIDEGTANAVAARHDGKYFVGVNWATVILLEELFYRLLSFPEVMPWVGDIKKLHTDPIFSEHPLKQDISDIFGTFMKREPTSYPQDDLRKSAARCMAHVAHLAVIAHELRHVYGGHLRFSSTNDASILEEKHSINAVANEGLISQAIERDADLAGLNNTLSHLIGWHAYVDNYFPEYGIFFDTHKHVIESTLFIHDVYLKIFDLTPPPNEEVWSTFSHPPLIVRRSMFVDRILESIRDKNTRNFRYIEPLLLNDIAPRVYAISETIINPLFGMPKRSETSALLKTKIEEHKIRIESAWQEINPALSKVRYFSLSWDISP